MASRKTFLIIDGNAIIHRAYHAIPQTLFTKKHELVNAVFGFTSMFLQALNKLHPDYIICTFDPPTKSFRNDLYSPYKEHRKKMDEELANQLEQIRSVVNAFQIPIFQVDGFEADDVIGTLANKIKKDDEIEVLILTGDRDLLQLLAKNVRVILPGKSFADMITYDEKAFLEKYGFDSKFLVDYKALFGDTSDNIPGVKKVGEKTATDLIKQFSSIEDLYNNLEEVKPSTRSLLETGKDLAFLSKTLAKIRDDVPLNLSIEEASFQEYDESKVLGKFRELEFNSLVKRLPNTPKHEVESETIDYSKLNYTRIEKNEDIKILIQKIKETKILALDCETTSLEIIQNSLVGISFGFEDKSAFFLPIKEGKIQLDDNFFSIHGENALLDELWLLLNDSQYQKVGHNIKFDMHALKLADIAMNGIVFDTMLASHLLNNHRNDLKGLVAEYEGINMVTFETLTNKGETYIHDLNVQDLSKYACADADMTFRLYKRFLTELGKEESLLSLFYQIELPLISVLFQMEQTGVKIDVRFLRQLGKQLGLTIEELRNEIYKIVGHEFNINSPKQLSEIIHQELNLPKGKKTKTGFSTDERYFNSIGNVHPIVQPLRIYKELIKLKSTYVDVLPNMVDNSNRLHTSYNQTITSTGRLSSTNPNLQNIPVRTEFGKQVRNAFIADKDCLLIAFDYSQVELRIMAHLSQDEKLIQSFCEGKDIHIQTGQLIFNKEDLTSDERRIAKTINFGIIYGISAYGLAGQLGLDRTQAQKFIDTYFVTFPQVHRYIEEQKKQLFEKQYTVSLMGRKRIFEGINKVGVVAQQAMIREAINMPLQAANAEIIKIAMNMCQEYIQEQKIQAKMILQIHDELIFEFYPTDGLKIDTHSISSDYLKDAPIEMRSFVHKVSDIMEHALELTVPIKVECAVGCNWGNMVKQKEFEQSTS